MTSPDASAAAPMTAGREPSACEVWRAAERPGLVRAEGRRESHRRAQDASRERAPSPRHPIQQVEGDAHDAALIGVGQLARGVLQRTRDILGLVIRIPIDGNRAGLIPHQIVVDDLVDAAVVAGEPVVDRREVADDAPVDAGFLGDLAQRGLLGGRTLEVALG